MAVEGCHGAGRPLAQRLVADSEPVLDVPAKLAARVRVYSRGHGGKTDKDDAVSMGLAALDGTGVLPVTRDDATASLRLRGRSPGSQPQAARRRTRVIRPGMIPKVPVHTRPGLPGDHRGKSGRCGSPDTILCRPRWRRRSEERPRWSLAAWRLPVELASLPRPPETGRGPSALQPWRGDAHDGVSPAHAEERGRR